MTRQLHVLDALRLTCWWQDKRYKDKIAKLLAEGSIEDCHPVNACHCSMTQQTACLHLLTPVGTYS